MRSTGLHKVTPDYVFKYASYRWGPFSVDLAADENNTKCETFISREQDALTCFWDFQDCVGWMNPPWNNIGPFARRAVDHVRDGDISRVVLLLPTRTGQYWFEELCMFGQVIYITGPGRIKFGASSGKTGSGGFEDCMFVVLDRYTIDRRRQVPLFVALKAMKEHA